MWHLQAKIKFHTSPDMQNHSSTLEMEFCFTIVTPLYEAADNLQIIVLISWCTELGCSDHHMDWQMCQDSERPKRNLSVWRHVQQQSLKMLF